MHFALIAAVDQKMGLGKNNTLPWRLPGELQHFSQITTEVKNPHGVNAVIMGRKTWESLPNRSKPLAHRINVVLSRETTFPLPEGVIAATSLSEALEKLKDIKDIENIFVIGGGKVFEEAIKHPLCQKIYMTQIEADFQCDTFFPPIDSKVFQLVESSDTQEENKLKYQYLTYKKVS